MRRVCVEVADARRVVRSGHRIDQPLVQRRFQNGEVSPSSSKSFIASSSVLRRHSGFLRSAPYHARASSHPCSSERTAPRSKRQEAHHLSTCSSDRKRSIVFHVNTMSFHQSRAGTAKWINPSPSTLAFVTLISAAVPQSAQLALIRASWWSIAAIPRASQMQFP